MDDEQRQNEETTMSELFEMNRRLIAINERYAAQMVEVLRILAADAITLADLAAPGDNLETAMVRHCRQRAQRILAGLGDDRVAN